MGIQERKGSVSSRYRTGKRDKRAIRVARSVIGTECESTRWFKPVSKKAMREGTRTVTEHKGRCFENEAQLPQPLAVDSTFLESTDQFIHIQARIREQTYAQEDNKAKGTEVGKRNRRGHAGAEFGRWCFQGRTLTAINILIPRQAA